MPRKHGQVSDPAKLRPAHTVRPVLLKEQSTLGALTQTLTTSITPLIGGLTTSLRNASGTFGGQRAASSGASGGGATLAPPPRPAFTEGSSGEDDEVSFSARTGSRRRAGSEGGSTVLRPRPRPGIWSTFADVGGRRHLIVLERDGLRLWDSSELEDLREVSFIRWDHLQRPGTRKSSVSDRGSPVQARILEPAVDGEGMDFNDNVSIVVLFAGRDRSRLEVVDLASQSIVGGVEVKGVATELQSNQQMLVVGTRSPLALHIFGSNLSRTRYSPIAADLSPHPTRGAPVFALGSSRLLAYATAKCPSEREPGVAGRGFSHPTSAAHSAHVNEAPTSPGGVGPSSRSTSGSWRDSVSSSVEAVEVARRVGGGLMSGAKALGSWGHQYWTNSMNPSSEGARSGLRAFSRSAPQPSLHVGMDTVLEDEDDEDGGEETVARPVAIGASGAQGARRMSLMNGGDQGHVRIVDLGSSPSCNSSTPPVIAHFTANYDSLALLSFNPASSFLLVAPIEGHAFDVFELRPPSRVGKSATRGRFGGEGDGRRGKDAKVWHRYKLYRGFTTAETKRVGWNWDSRVVAIATERGTHHLYAIHPAGGPDDKRSLFQPTIINPTSFQPLSVSLSSFAKIRAKAYGLPPPLPSQVEPSPQPCLMFLPPRTSSRRDSTSNDALLSPMQCAWPSALLHDATTGQMTLHCLEIKRTQPAAVRAAQSQARSGLSQLMQRKPAEGVASGSGNDELNIGASSIALWDLAPPVDKPDASLNYYPPPALTFVPHRGRSERWTSFAEIATFSRSLKILPRSIYTAHQFTFALLSDAATGDLVNGCVSGPRKTIHVRQEVEIAPGEHAPMLRASSSGGDTSPTQSRMLYGEPIRSAVETVLDAPTPFSPESPSYLAPAFPNGLPGKHGNRWSSAIALTANVKPSLVGAHDRMRRELGRLNRGGPRRPSDTCPTSSVSFDTDDEAVSVEPTTLDSTTPRSSVSDGRDMGGDGNEADDDWAAWNDECPPSGDRPATLMAQQQRHISPVLGPTPFELDEEWDDPVTSKPIVPGSRPITVITPEPATMLPSQASSFNPGSLSTSPLLTVPSMDSAQGSSSDDSELESKESRFVEESVARSDFGSATIKAVPPPPQPALKSRKAKHNRRK